MAGTKAQLIHASSRANLFRNLAAKWIKLHRPDVEAAIRAECDKVYPPVRAASVMPASLEKLK